MINNVVLLFSTTSEEIHCEQLLRYWYLSPKRTLYSLLLDPPPPPNPHRPAIFAYVVVGDLEIKVSPYFEGLSQAHYAMVICFQYAFFSSRRKHPLPVLVRVSERLSQC